MNKNLEEKEDISCSFILYGDEVVRMFNWLTPFIERAGYKWSSKTLQHEFGKVHVEIFKETRCNEPEWEKRYDIMAWQCKKCNYAVNFPSDENDLNRIEDYLKEQHKKRYEN